MKEIEKNEYEFEFMSKFCDLTDVEQLSLFGRAVCVVDDMTLDKETDEKQDEHHVNIL